MAEHTSPLPKSPPIPPRPRLTYLHDDTLKTASKGGGAHFEDEISQLVTLPFGFHLGILALLVIVFEFVHQAVKQCVRCQAQARVGDGETGGRLLAVVQDVDCLGLGWGVSAKDNL